MGHFYGTNLFMAETSTTSGGLDSLLEPTGTIKAAHEKAARAFGSDHTYFVTNGTSTANKIVVQALCAPGDVVLVDRNCHKSHHYGMVLSGAQPYYIDAYPLKEFSMYGGVPLKSIKKALLDMKSEGKLDKARMVLMTFFGPAHPGKINLPGGAIVLPLAILALCALVAGFLETPASLGGIHLWRDWIGDTFGATAAHGHDALSLEILLQGLAAVAALGEFGAAQFWTPVLLQSLFDE